MQLPFNTKRINVIGVHHSTNEQFSLGLLVLNYKSGNLTIEKSINKIPDFLTISTHLAKKSEILLNVTGSEVIYRQVQKVENGISDVNILNMAYPGSSLNTLAWSIVRVDNGSAFVSTIRKELILQHANHLNSQGYFVTSFIVGAMIGGFFGHLLKDTQYYDVIPSGELDLNFASQSLSGFIVQPNEAIETTIAWDSNILERWQIPLLSVALNHVTSSDDLSITSTSIPEFTNTLLESKYYHKFTRFLKYFLAIALFVLAINGLIFTKLTQEKTILEEELSNNSGLLEKLSKQKESIKNKERLINIYGIGSQKTIAKLADDIGKAVPENGISFVSLDLFPLNSKLSDEKPVFRPNYIRIQGEADEVLYLNRLIQNLTTCNWVKDIKLVNFKTTSNQNAGTFCIELITMPAL